MYQAAVAVRPLLPCEANDLERWLRWLLFILIVPDGRAARLGARIVDTRAVRRAAARLSDGRVVQRAYRVGSPWCPGGRRRPQRSCLMLGDGEWRLLLCSRDVRSMTPWRICLSLDTVCEEEIRLLRWAEFSW